MQNLSINRKLVMDWNAKWDWQYMERKVELAEYGPKQQQTTDWGIEQGEGIMCKGPFSLFESKGSSSGSELAPGCSARSSISVCTDPSFKEVMRYTQADFGNINAFSGDFREKEELDESSPPLDYSIGSGESMIGLELGKRMYFGNTGTGGNTNGGPHSSLASSVKKIKSSKQITTPRCQVEGCNIDLSSAKEYHRKHKVCATHSKFPKVVVKGLERRFCQQCSRFHSLSEFDEMKRSCRKRLSDHNTRRRKLQFNATRVPSPFSAFTSSDGRRQMIPHVYSSRIPHVHSSRSSSECTWENAFRSKLMSTKEEEEGVLLNFGETHGFKDHLQLAGTRALNLPGHSPNTLLPSKKGTRLEILSRGLEPVSPPNMNTAPEFQRALSLLSNETWMASYPNNSVGHSINHQPLMDHHSTHYDTSHFQPFKPPYQDVLHSNLYN